MHFSVRGVSAQLSTQGYRMDPVLRAMLEEFDKGYKLLKKMERRATAHIIDIGISIAMSQYALNLFLSN